MFNYRFFGIQFESAIRFDELPESTGTPDIRILLGDIPDWADDDTRASRIDGRFYDYFRFVILNGNTIIIDIVKNISDAEVLARLQGELMSALLRQRGLLVLHACCVSRNGKAIGFMGGTCWGKSTLAEFFCQNGYRLLSDDILAIDLSIEAPTVFPGYPEIHLRKEAGDWLRKDYASLPQRSSNAVQRISKWNKSNVNDSLPLTNLYVLEKEFAQTIGIVKLKAHQQFIELIRHTRSSNLLVTAPYTTTQFRLCSKLVKNVPIRRLERVKSLNLLPELLTLVENNVSE